MTSRVGATWVFALGAVLLAFIVITVHSGPQGMTALIALVIDETAHHYGAS
jgi:hypothetical protein